MNEHKAVSRTLHEYLRGELDPAASARAAAHIGRCPRCSEAARNLGAIIDHLHEGTKPSDALPDSWWTGFTNEVMARIPAGPVPQPGFLQRLFMSVSPRGMYLPARLMGAMAAVAAIAVAVVLFAVRPGEDTPAAADAADAGGEGGRFAERTVPEADSIDPLTDFDRRLSEYFTRSKALLVGVSNIEPASGGTVDLSAERELSSALLREGRYLQSGPVDFRSSVLLEDLDMIMIELANGSSDKPAPSVELIRVSIEDKNLLFKLRMRETRHYPIQVRQASHQR